MCYSKKCHDEDWLNHVRLCATLNEDREQFAHHTQIETALDDMWAWARYFDTPLKNCAIASSFLNEFTIEEANKEFLCVQIAHNGRSDVPAQYRFNVVGISRKSSEFGTVPQVLKEHPHTVYEEAIPGREEMGNEYYGSLSFVVESVFHGRYTYAWMKRFHIDKRVAQARPLHREWWLVLRQYTDSVSKVKLPCAKGAPGLGCEWGDWELSEQPVSL
ncbi:hypothetical protein AAF712_010383 [Marasmius tenuissimus]|uniref:Uncharacterized protein n=1 Tax=Marasmius tenuissimus TaxID=585030 RepID=A0ABR2ZNX4_9AGAR